MWWPADDATRVSSTFAFADPPISLATDFPPIMRLGELDYHCYVKKDCLTFFQSKVEFSKKYLTFNDANFTKTYEKVVKISTGSNVYSLSNLSCDLPMKKIYKAYRKCKKQGRQNFWSISKTKEHYQKIKSQNIL